MGGGVLVHFPVIGLGPRLRKLRNGLLLCQVLLHKNLTYFPYKSILGTCEDATPF
jgi:hypothetical protein